MPWIDVQQLLGRRRAAHFGRSGGGRVGTDDRLRLPGGCRRLRSTKLSTSVGQSWFKNWRLRSCIVASSTTARLIMADEKVDSRSTARAAATSCSSSTACRDCSFDSSTSKASQAVPSVSGSSDMMAV